MCGPIVGVSVGFESGWLESGVVGSKLMWGVSELM